jgi:hypothetical protein
MRALIALSSGLLSAAATAVLYTFVMTPQSSGASSELPGLSSNMIAALALLSSILISAPFEAALLAVVRAAGASERDITLRRHEARVRTVHAGLDNLSTGALLRLAGTQDVDKNLDDDGDAVPPSHADIIVLCDAAKGKGAEVESTPALARSALAVALFFCSFIAVMYAMSFVLSRGAAAGAGIIAAWALGSILFTCVLRPCFGLAATAISFILTARSAKPRSVPEFWHVGVAIPRAASLAAPRSALWVDEAVSAFAPLIVLSTAWFSDPRSRLRWAAAAAAVRAVLSAAKLPDEEKDSEVPGPLAPEITAKQPENPVAVEVAGAGTFGLKAALFSAVAQESASVVPAQPISPSAAPAASLDEKIAIGFPPQPFAFAPGAAARRPSAMTPVIPSLAIRPRALLPIGARGAAVPLPRGARPFVASALQVLQLPRGLGLPAMPLPRPRPL